MMYSEWPTILTGTWQYNGKVACRVRIVRGDIRFGSGDRDDSQDIREDVPGDWYYVVYVNYDGSETGGGCWESLEVARNAVSRVTGDSLVWDVP